MNERLALRVLGQVMAWDDPRCRVEFQWLAMMASLKYDGYSGYLTGARFLESLVDWLQQFKPTERQAAYDFVRHRLIFVSAQQMQHLVELVYPETIQPLLIDATAQQLSIPRYLVWSNPNAESRYKQLLRRCLFLGLSDGARIDQFRRANVGRISNEQVAVSPDLTDDKWDSLVKELRKDTKDQSAIFDFVFLIDDFIGSGTTLLRFENGACDGKLRKFWSKVKGKCPSHVSPSFTTVVHHYICTAKAKALVPATEQQARQQEDWFTTPVRFSETMVLPDDLPLNATNAGAMAPLIDFYYDPAIETDSFKKGKTDGKYGFAAGGLPLILEHNTPNNSIGLLWAESVGGTNVPAMRPLFPRRQRHL